MCIRDRVCPYKGRVYYVDAVHGDLPKTREAFEGYIDLIERGRTDRLPASPHLPRGASAEALTPYDTGDAAAALYPCLLYTSQAWLRHR